MADLYSGLKENNLHRYSYMYTGIYDNIVDYDLIILTLGAFRANFGPFLTLVFNFNMGPKKWVLLGLISFYFYTPLIHKGSWEFVSLFMFVF